MTDPPQEARVIVAYGAKCRIELASGEQFEANVRKSAGKPVCGDRVQVIESPETWIVVRIEPRENEFPRADRRAASR